jgi:hypothetical protein
VPPSQRTERPPSHWPLRVSLALRLPVLDERRSESDFKLDSELSRSPSPESDTSRIRVGPLSESALKAPDPGPGRPGRRGLGASGFCQPECE